MPEVATSVVVDSLLLRATFMSAEERHVGRSSGLRKRAIGPYVHEYLQVFDPPPGRRLGDISDALLGLQEFMRLAMHVGADKVIDGPYLFAFSDSAATTLSGLQVGYEVLSVEMHSPLVVVLHVPPAEAAAFGFAILGLAERLVTIRSRVSRARAKNLRDKAQYDEERRLIENGRLDLAAGLLRNRTLPDQLDIVGGDEDFDTTEAIESRPAG
jgi:hypothetical protein